MMEQQAIAYGDKEELKVKSEEKSSSLKKIDDQLSYIISKTKSSVMEEERKRELDKNSELLARKLHEEETKEIERRRKLKEAKEQSLCKLCGDQIDNHELYVMDSCDDVFHKECIEAQITERVYCDNNLR